VPASSVSYSDTNSLPVVPPLHVVERGPGGEDRGVRYNTDKETRLVTYRSQLPAPRSLPNALS